MLTLHDSGAYARFSPYGADEAQLPPHGRVHDPEPPLRRLRRVHEPRADDRDARLRRHVGVVRDRDAHEPDRRGARDRPVRAPAARTRTGSATRRRTASPTPTRPRCRRSRRSRTPLGHELPADYRDDDPRAARGRPAPGAPRRPAREPGGSLMAKHKGRGVSAIEYPTGMNQNGDPSQAWIKIKPDGRVDVFAGTSDIGNGSKTIQSQIVAETLGVPYEWVTYDNSNTDSSPVCTGTFASRATFVAGMAVQKAAEKVRERMLEIAVEGARDRPGRPRHRRRRGDREGLAAEEDQRPGRGRGGDLDLRRADHRHRRAAQAVRGDRRPGARAASTCRRTRRSRTRPARPRSRSTTRPARCASTRLVAVLRRRPRDQPDARRGADRGRRDAGPRARRARELLPVLPERRAPRQRSSARTSRPGMEDLPELEHADHREPVRRRPVRRQGDRRDGEQPAAAGDRRRPSTTRSASGSRSCRSRPSACCARSRRSAEPRARGQGGRSSTSELSVNTVAARARVQVRSA